MSPADNLVFPRDIGRGQGKLKDRLSASLYMYNNALIRRGRHREIFVLIIVSPQRYWCLTAACVVFKKKTTSHPEGFPRSLRVANGCPSDPVGPGETKKSGRWRATARTEIPRLINIINRSSVLTAVTQKKYTADIFPLDDPPGRSVNRSSLSLAAGYSKNLIISSLARCPSAFALQIGRITSVVKVGNWLWCDVRMSVETTQGHKWNEEGKKNLIDTWR